jgi:hypothetical protein
MISIYLSLRFAHGMKKKGRKAAGVARGQWVLPDERDSTLQSAPAMSTA